MAGVHLASRPLDGRNAHEAGRALLEELYRYCVGSNPPPVLCTPRGKPYFETGPWHFSISHTKTRVFCALAQCPVGIDAEDLERRINLKLAEKILSEQEYRQYSAAEDPRLALLTFWVLKEAGAKLSGEGLQGYPNHTNFSLDDPRVTIQDGCLLAVLTKGD